MTADGGDWLGEEPDISDADVYAEVSADVIVVGLGLAGVSAARAAAEAGATVIGIDGASTPQCRSGEYTVINSPTLNARWPERALSREEVDEIVDAHLNESGYRVKRAITAKWAANIGEALTGSWARTSICLSPRNPPAHRGRERGRLPRAHLPPAALLH